MIDSHTHLFLCEGAEADLVAAAREAGVGRMLNVGLGGDTNPVAIAAAERHEEVFAAVGCHPNSAEEFDGALGEEIARLAGHERGRAVREAALDFLPDTAGPPPPQRAPPGADAGCPESRQYRAAALADDH